MRSRRGGALPGPRRFTPDQELDRGVCVCLSVCFWPFGWLSFWLWPPLSLSCAGAKDAKLPQPRARGQASHRPSARPVSRGLCRNRGTKAHGHRLHVLRPKLKESHLLCLRGTEQGQSRRHCRSICPGSKPTFIIKRFAWSNTTARGSHRTDAPPDPGPCLASQHRGAASSVAAASGPLGTPCGCLPGVGTASKRGTQAPSRAGVAMATRGRLQGGILKYLS